jgi:hypothetical protein
MLHNQKCAASIILENDLVFMQEYYAKFVAACMTTDDWSQHKRNLNSNVSSNKEITELIKTKLAKWQFSTRHSDAVKAILSCDNDPSSNE